jgi:hypothetical protein
MATRKKRGKATADGESVVSIEKGAYIASLENRDSLMRLYRDTGLKDAVQKTAKASNSGPVHERLPRFKAWAMHLSHDALAEIFAQLLATHLVVRKSHRDQEREWKIKKECLKDELLDCQNIIELHECVQENQREEKSEAAKKRDKEKREAKEGARIFWLEWLAGKHPELLRVEQFADEVMKRWPVLTDHKNICTWSAEWTKKANARKPRNRPPTPK